MSLPLKPKKGGFQRLVSCGLFIFGFLLGEGPYGSTRIDPETGAPQAAIFREYKLALLETTAVDRATRDEEIAARKERRRIDPDNIAALAGKHISRLPYKANGCRYHSFVVYFSDIKRLGWVEPTGRTEISEFQANYPPGPPRVYFRLTDTGKNADTQDWANPHRALYGT